MTGPDPGTRWRLGSLKRPIAVLTGGTVIGQAASIVRDLFIAGQVGLSPELDALLIAWGVPTALAAILSSGTSAALVPAFVETRLNFGLDPARRLAGAVALWATAGAGVLAAVIFVAADPIVSIVGIGLSEPDRAVAATYLQMMVPIAVIACLQHILLAVSQAEGRFATMSASNLAQPVTTLVVVLALWRWTGLTAVALAFLLGPLASLLVLLVDGVRSSTIPIPSLFPRRVGIRGLVRHASPLTLSAALLPLNVIVDRAIASLVTPGGVSALRYAETLVRTPVSAIGPAWGSALYPALVRTARDGVVAIGESTGVAIRYATAVFVPLSVLLMALAPLVVEVIYGRGAFDAEAAELTTGAVAGYAPMVAALMITPVLITAHNALHRGYVLLATGALNVTLNFTLNVLLAPWLGVAGVAASSSITAVILIFFLGARMGELRAAHQLRTIFGTLIRSLAAVAAPAVVVGLVVWTGIPMRLELPAVIAVAFLGFASVATWLAIGMALRQPEIGTLLADIARMAGRALRWARRN